MSGATNAVLATLDARDEAIFVTPTAGYDSYGVQSEGFYDPQADAAFRAELKAGLSANIQVVERDTHIDDPAFTTAAAPSLIALIEKRQKK
jgi:uncharacterized protein (UPF0261 family)